MTCPMHKGKTKEDALCLANKMKKITVADTLENMEVFISPFSVHNGDICSIYKLKIRLVKPGRYFKKSDISVEDCQHIFKKQQTTYEMDYEDDSGGEQLESEIDMSKDEKIAENAAKKVYVQSFGKIDRCRVTDCSENQVFYYGEDPKKRKTQSDKEKIPALHTAGVDLGVFREMEDQLDVRYLYANGIHAMLNSCGYPAPNTFMTHTGRYRPMSRLGAIADSIAPFSKMSFETASKLIVEAAKHGLLDNLETPSSRICLGLPAKMGTGSFDLMHQLES
ncbi:hypothetical protein GOBAR_AA38899 [Gossypium barbadense]|uniref:DNA-directed RNA polymerase I subunit RPA1 n=1 Tax=Gossypium barbadense TaxID=3634 RepID=A0A2P5VSK7_GOSBA|nr:hypothetical protein GOBAR_AA38899 [Gossypium barbadense]